jgi:hypothetical protein
MQGGSAVDPTEVDGSRTGFDSTQWQTEFCFAVNSAAALVR